MVIWLCVIQQLITPLTYSSLMNFQWLWTTKSGARRWRAAPNISWSFDEWTSLWVSQHRPLSLTISRPNQEPRNDIDAERYRSGTSAPRSVLHVQNVSGVSLSRHPPTCLLQAIKKNRNTTPSSPSVHQYIKPQCQLHFLFYLVFLVLKKSISEHKKVRNQFSLRTHSKLSTDTIHLRTAVEFNMTACTSPRLYFSTPVLLHTCTSLRLYISMPICSFLTPSYVSAPITHSLGDHYWQWTNTTDHSQPNQLYV